jgi:hypothetical protein
VHTFAFALGSAGEQRSDVFIREQVIRATLDLELVVRLHRRSPAPPPFTRDAARRACRSGGTGVLAHDHRRVGGFRDRGRGQIAADRSQGVGIAATGGLHPPAQLLLTGSSVEWLTPDVLAAPWWRVI